MARTSFVLTEDDEIIVRKTINRISRGEDLTEAFRKEFYMPPADTRNRSYVYRFLQGAVRRHIVTQDRRRQRDEDEELHLHHREMLLEDARKNEDAIFSGIPENDR